MDINALTGIAATEYQNAVADSVQNIVSSDEDFDSVLSAAMNMLTETNALQNDTESEKIKFALGEADNAHDLQIAEQKALTALNYTVAVRDKMLDAYKEIMNMQI